MSSCDFLSLFRGYTHVYDHNIQTSSLEPLGQSKPNFMWGIVRKEKQKVIKMVQVRGPRSPPHSKNLVLQNRETYDFETLSEASVNGALQSLYKS